MGRVFRGDVAILGEPTGGPRPRRQSNEPLQGSEMTVGNTKPKQETTTARCRCLAVGFVFAIHSVLAGCSLPGAIAGSADWSAEAIADASIVKTPIADSRTINMPKGTPPINTPPISTTPSGENSLSSISTATDALSAHVGHVGVSPATDPCATDLRATNPPTSVSPTSVSMSNAPAERGPDASPAHDTTSEYFPARPQTQRSLFSRIAGDHRNFYSGESLTSLGYGLGIGAVMANTNFDSSARNHFQASVRSASVDEWYHALRAQKELGNGYYTIPVFAAAWAAGSLLEGRPGAGNVGEWGERSIRGILVGAPPMLSMQYVLGASRPGESTSRSHWQPFQDNNGVSGHAFMGSIPFLTAAQMSEDRWLKAAFYAGSALVPLSRINDDDHFTSQAFLGWWFAFLATSAVEFTQSDDSHWTLSPWLGSGTSGFALERRF